jgi:hypothetical protein
VYIALLDARDVPERDYFLKAAYVFRGPFVHADLCFSDQGGDRSCISSTSITRRTDGISFGDRTMEGRRYHWLHIPCTRKNVDTMRDAARAFTDEGAPPTHFSAMAFARAATCCPAPRPGPHTTGWFCSQYITAVLQLTGLVDPDVNPSQVSVTELYELCRSVPGATCCRSPVHAGGGDDDWTADQVYNEFKQLCASPEQRTEPKEHSKRRRRRYPPGPKVPLVTRYKPSKRVHAEQQTDMFV